MLVWLFALVVGSGVVAGGLLVYLRWSPEKKSPSVDVAVEPTPTTQPAAKATAPSSTQTPNKEAPAKPEESRGIVTDQQKSMADKEPTGVLADAPPKPEPLVVSQEPELGIVSDTPKGLYAARTEPKTPEWLAARGGTLESQKAVDDGLNWLARHQAEDGHWGADCLGTAPNSRCDQNAPCLWPGEGYEIAQTGLALLAFQAAGHYYFNGQKYSGQVAKGLDFLVEDQAPDGSIVGSKNPSPEQVNAGRAFQAHFMYEHAIGTFALCEACAVAIAEGTDPDPRYQIAAARAVYFIESVQHDDGGWRYRVNAGDESDCSVSGWVMLALKSAREAKVNVSPETISRMMKFFAAHYADGRTSYVVGAPGSPTMTGVGMMAVEFFDHKLDSPIVQGGAAYLADAADGIAPKPPGAPGTDFRPPENKNFSVSFLAANNYYLWYNCTMAMFQIGGKPWKRWNGALRDGLVALQVQGEGCERGSWPFGDFTMMGGRIYSTALAVLTLEVYYRFQRIAGQPEKEKFFEK
jgi:hypothetical protein